jgi:hypothetical protein
MTVLYFPLGRLGDEMQRTTTHWRNKLEAVQWEFPPNGDERETAKRAMWRGSPFILAGENDTLDRYLEDLDGDSAEVLKDCAYFWVLTGSGEYTHRHLPTDRPVNLDWNNPSQHIVSAALKRLVRFERLKGLSRSTDIVRRRIEQLAEGETGPGCSVLILGPSGSGKEEVAQALVNASERKNRGMQALSGAWLNMEPGMAMSELVGLSRGLESERIDGLLKQLSERAMFIDDFESAAACVQETLLRVMSVPEGSPAPFRPVGGQSDLITNVWPIFATNRDVKSFARPDFLYRFGARIVWLRPLDERPADFPAIAQAVWTAIWERHPTNKDGKPEGPWEPLRSGAVKHLFAADLNWDGNVRALAALLRLVAADMRNPSMNGWSQERIINQIISRGRGYWDWVNDYGRRLSVGPTPDAGDAECVVLASASPMVGRVGVCDEPGLKAKLEQALLPQGVALLGDLETILKNRAKDGKPCNTPGRHLFYAALLFLALKHPHEASSADLKDALRLGKAHVHNLCSTMVELFSGPLAELCVCQGGAQTRFHFEMPATVVR